MVNYLSQKDQKNLKPILKLIEIGVREIPTKDPKRLKYLLKQASYLGLCPKIRVTEKADRLIVKVVDSLDVVFELEECDLDQLLTLLEGSPESIIIYNPLFVREEFSEYPGYKADWQLNGTLVLNKK